jgi:WS/DGAT/MGAT family acyltransferase
MTKVDRHLRPSDAFTWYMERDPVLRSTVVVTGLLDSRPDRDLLRARLDHATRAVPTFRDRIVVPPLHLARPRWERVDPDLNWHLRHVSAPPPGGLAEVLELARNAATTPFDPARPPWTFTLVEGVQGDRAAFVMAFHHSLTDGIGGINLAAQLFDLQRDPTARLAVPAPSPERLEGWRLWLDTAAYDVSRLGRVSLQLPGAVLRGSAALVRHPRQAAETTASVARTVEPYFTTLSEVMRGRRLHRSLDVIEVSLSELRAAAAAHEGHLNDAFLAAVTGGLRRYHAEHGASVGDLRVTLPLSLRTESDPAGGNRITLMRFRLPAAISDAGERLRATHATVQRIRRERSLPHTQTIAAALNMLPAAVVGGMLKHVDFLASNVPGMPVPIYLAGAKVDSWYPFGPTIGAAVNVTLMSYEDRCCIGVNVDTAAVPDPERLVACLCEGFAEILDLGGENTGVHHPLGEAAAWAS